MAIMLTLRCPVPVHSRVFILPIAWGTAWVFDLYVSVLAECYNLFVLILTHNTEYSVHSICEKLRNSMKLFSFLFFYIVNI